MCEMDVVKNFLKMIEEIRRVLNWIAGACRAAEPFENMPWTITVERSIFSSIFIP